MSLKAFIKRLESLEQRLTVIDQPKVPPFDYDLLTPREQELSDVIHLHHDKAVELGYGKLEACRYHFRPGCNPWLNPEIFEECVEAFTDEERLRFERANEIFEKCKRLTEKLTEEEKESIKQYNRITLWFENELMRNCDPDRYTQQDLEEARLLYEQLLAKCGEKSYEC